MLKKKNFFYNVVGGKQIGNKIGWERTKVVLVLLSWLSVGICDKAGIP